MNFQAYYSVTSLSLPKQLIVMSACTYFYIVCTYMLHHANATMCISHIVSADYVNTAVDLTFGPSNKTQCVLIPVINDMVPETLEQFRVKLAMTTPLPGIVLTPDTATIVINDDDGE